MIVETRGDVIKLSGALVENQWPALKSAVSLLLSQYPTGAVIDASGLTEVSEAGARTFLDASSYIQAKNARVVVAGMPEDILAEIRNIPGVRSQLVVADTVEEARSSLEAGGTGVVREKRVRPAILVPLISAWTRAIQFAANEAVARKAELHLLYVLQIPRNQPLGVPLPDMEREAQDTLAEAEKALRRRGVTVRKLTTRARETVEGIAKFAAENSPELLVVGYSKEEMDRDGGRYSAIGVFCHEAPCDVAILCVTD